MIWYLRKYYIKKILTDCALTPTPIIYIPLYNTQARSSDWTMTMYYSGPLHCNWVITSHHGISILIYHDRGISILIYHGHATYFINIYICLYDSL